MRSTHSSPDKDTKSQLIQGGTIVTMNLQQEVFVGDLRIEQGRIKELGKNLSPLPGELVIPARENFVIPGLIQTHTHVCQALFRGLADDLSLLKWLTEKIWPFEAAHHQASMSISAQLAFMEMQLLGTTCVLDMGSSRHTDAIFAAAHESGMRYAGGNCWTDIPETSGPIYMTSHECIKESENLIKTWHHFSPLIDFVVSPRFVVSCSDDILFYAQSLQKEEGFLVHTHAAENREEIEIILERTGRLNIDHLDSIGLLHPRTVLVHCVHLQPHELKKISQNKTKIVHCPSSNLKLASGIAPIEEYRLSGVTLGLGSDGAPCNNTMDPFIEMRLAALLQKPLFGAEALPAKVAFEMATLGGARVLGKEDTIGSLEIGKDADIVIVDRSHPSSANIENPYSSLVYSSSGRDVQHVWIRGRQVVKNFSSTLFDQKETIKNAQIELKQLLQRVH